VSLLASTGHTRREALRLLLASSALAAAPWRVARSDAVYDGPFVDAHAHLNWDAGVSLDTLMSLYDAAGVQGALLFGYPWQLAADTSARYPGRLVPFLAEGYAHALHPDSSYMHPDGLEQLLSAGVVGGLGEVICRHSAFQLGASGGYYAEPSNNVPANHPALIQAYQVAGRSGVPVNIHQEWFFADELERAFQAVPETTFVWAHAGHGSADTARGVLRRSPNVLADLSARTPWIGPGTVLLRRDGTLDPAWAGVLEDYADRFLVGLDLFAPAHYQVDYVSELVDYYRGLLGQLDRGVAELIGHANAERIASFGGA
jgi:Amidohydrolase